MGQLPPDRDTLPLCDDCHNFGGGKVAQHQMGERSFWAHLGLDPAKIIRALVAISGDDDAGLAIIKTCWRTTARYQGTGDEDHSL